MSSSYSNVVWWIPEQPDSCLTFCTIVAIYEGIVLFQKLYNIAIQQYNLSDVLVRCGPSSG